MLRRLEERSVQVLQPAVLTRVFPSSNILSFNVIFEQNNVCAFLFKCYHQFSLMEWLRGYNVYRAFNFLCF